MPERRGESVHSPGRKSKSVQLSGLALIESLYFGTTPHAAQERLRRLLGSEQSDRPYAISEAGQPSIGLHLNDSDEISLLDFSPPASWNPAFSIQFVRFGNKEKDEYLFHQGEQLVIPVDGEIQFHFFWSPGGQKPERTLLSNTADGNTILRINPQVPHHAWAVRGEAWAWVVLRHATNSPAALVMGKESSETMRIREGSSDILWVNRSSITTTRVAARRRARGPDLRRGGAYAMIAWGISDSIREARQRAGLTTTDLANQVGIDPSSLSRLEEAKANVSIEMLAKVCRALRIGIAERMDSGSWIYEREMLDPKATVLGEAMLKVPVGTHALHPHLIRAAERAQLKIATGANTQANQIASWIVLKGKVLLELPEETGGKSMIADAGNVVHFRQAGDLGITVLQSCTIVQLVHSQACTCKSRGAAARG